MELLRYDALPRIAPDARRRKVEERGIVHDDRLGNNRVAEPDVDLHRRSGGAQVALEANANAFIFCLLRDALSGDRRRVKLHAVGYHLLFAHIPHNVFQGGHVVRHRAQ